MHSEKYFEWGRKALIDNKITSDDGVVIVSYFLPVVLSKNANGFWSAAWDNETVLSLKLEARSMWVGSVRYQNAPIPVEEEENVAAALSHLSCYPVFVSQTMHLQFYDMFCKQNLWPIMHQIADVYGPLHQNDISANTQQNLWMVYSTVHNLFRDKILEVFQQGYLIWIHGFHLMLLPSFVRRRIPGAKIGYYLHTPFPSSEIWRTMSRREDLLRGILGADQVGFHLFEYARHFLTVCRRLLGCSFEINSSGMMVVNIDGREVTITCIHVGVDLPILEDIFNKSSFYGDTVAWRERFPNKIIVAGE
jgi:trehalose 6-phosphate synthase/phosphatase